MDYVAYILIVAIGLLTYFAVRVTKQRKRLQGFERLLSNTNAKLERLQVHFGRFTPQEVIEQLIEPEGSYTPQMRKVTVLFADLKGFTKMCHGMDPSEIVSIINGYFQHMSQTISEHHGQVTELTGDGILALFGALKNNPWQVQDAVMGALAMRKALATYNNELLARSLPQLSFGIGIHQGEVLTAVMGNFELSKFGVVGDTINMASRIESLTRVHNVDLLISKEVKDQLDERFSLEYMPPVHVKGKEEPVTTYYVRGLISDNSFLGPSEVRGLNL